MKRALAAMLVVVSAACSSSPTAPDPFTDSRSGSVNGSSGSLIQGASVDLTAPRAGTLTANLAWGSTAVDLDLFLTSNTCADITALVNSQCTFLARSDASLGTSERVTQAVTSGQALRLWVLNFSTAPQAFTISVDIR